MSKRFYLVGNRDGFNKIIFSKVHPKFADGYRSISSYYDTKKELIKDQGILKNPCKECGGLVKTTFSNNEKMIQRNVCFSCNFWFNIIDDIDNKLVIDGTVYVFHERAEAHTVAFLGHGGREFTIETNDGKVLSTNNLWSNGNVPDKFRDRIKDNAQFIDNV